MPRVTLSFILFCFVRSQGTNFELKLSEQLRGEGHEDLSERCRIVAEGGENSHYLRKKKETLTLQEMILSSAQDGGVCSLEAISLKKLCSIMRKLDLWKVIGRTQTRSSIFTFNGFD